MRRKLTVSIVLLGLLVIVHSALAVDLLQVFRQALAADAQLQMARSKAFANQQEVPINRAALLPNLNATGQYSRQTETGIEGVSPDSSTLSLNLTQPIINFSDWFNYKAAKMTSRAAVATYEAALQDLIVRTAQAYFDVLQAQDQLSFSIANRNALAEILHQDKLRFKAGLVKTVDVDNAQAAYETSLANVFADQITLTEKLANLQTITNVPYTQLTPLGIKLPLILPQPNNLSRWLMAVNQQNLTVLADRYTSEADNITIKAQNAGHFPNLNASAGYTHSVNNSVQYANGNTGSVNLTLTVPLYAGGQVSAETQQAAYNLQTQLGQTEYDYRNAIMQAQENYAGVVTGINKIKADNNIVLANQRAVKSTSIAYHAGLSSISISDLLNMQQTFYQSQRDAASDKYAYIMSLLKLKEAAGTLSVNDLLIINGWLK